MSKGVKILLWVLVILAALALLIYFLVVPWAKKIWDRITFSVPRLQGLDLKGLTLADITSIAFSGEEKQVDAQLGMDIKNENNFSIPFSNIKAKLFYDNELIAETTDDASHTVPANGIFPLSNLVNIHLNGAGGRMLIDKLQGKTPMIDYEVSANVFGVPIKNIKNNFTW